MLYVKNFHGVITAVSFDSDELDFFTKCQICDATIRLSGSDVYEEIRDSIDYDYPPDFAKLNCSAECRDIAYSRG